MSTMNRVTALVHLTRDPELRYLPTGKATVRLGFATNHEEKGEDGTVYEEVWYGTGDAYGRKAEMIAQWFHKGDPVLLEGRMKTEQWEKDGEKKSATKLVIETVHFLPGVKYEKRGAAPRDDSGGTTTVNRPAAAPRAAQPDPRIGLEEPR